MNAADSPSPASPRQVLERFFEAERRYMQEGGSFEELRATLADDVTLHQSPDLPWGGEYIGPGRYEEWARAMSAVFDRVDMQNPQFFEQGETVVIVGTLATRLRATGETMALPMAQAVSVKAGKITEFRPFYWNVPAYVDAARKRASQSDSRRRSMPMPDEHPTLTTIQRFYEAEAAYLTPGGGDFDALAATLDPECVPYQPASLPYGGEWRGPTGFEYRLKAFSAQWSSLEVKDPEFYPVGDVVCSRSHVHAVARAGAAKRLTGRCSNSSGCVVPRSLNYVPSTGTRRQYCPP